MRLFPRTIAFGLALALAASGQGIADEARAQLASIAPGETTSETGAARPLDLGGLQMQAPQSAQTLEVTYEVFIGGFHLATVNFSALVDQGHYVAGTALTTKGLADAFVSAEIQALSTGDVHGHLVVPHTYNSDNRTKEKRQLVGLLFNKGEPGALDSQPPYDLARFPVSDELKHATVDPLSAALFIALGSSVNDQNKCGSNVPIFDGKRRYSLTLSFDSDDKISLGKDSFNGGGPIAAYKCTAVYQRVAGFKPPKPGRQPTPVPPIDMWLVPVPGTDFLVPARMQAETGFGAAVVRAVKLKAKGSSSPG